MVTLAIGALKVGIDDNGHVCVRVAEYKITLGVHGSGFDSLFCLNLLRLCLLSLLLLETLPFQTFEALRDRFVERTRCFKFPNDLVQINR